MAQSSGKTLNYGNFIPGNSASSNCDAHFVVSDFQFL
jgi:hypothetical protein